jgi:hypothetical protein
MRKLLSIFLLAFAPCLIFGQANQNNFNTGSGTGSIPFAGVPTGSCSGAQTAVNTTNGNFYTCNAGAWSLSSGGSGNVATSGTPTNTQIAQWVDATHVQGVSLSSIFGPLTGDVSTSLYAATVNKINGNSVATGAAAHQVLDCTGANTCVWKTVPDCNGSTNALNYTQSSDAFSCLSISALSNPMTNQYDLLVGGAAGAPARFGAPASPSGIPQSFTYIPGTGFAYALGGIASRDVTGTTSTDTVLAADCSNRVNYLGSVAVAVSLPTPTTLAISACGTKLVNNTTGSSTAVTVTAASSFTINGSATPFAIVQNQYCVFSPDGASNWASDCNNAGSGSGSTSSSTLLSVPTVNPPVTTPFGFSLATSAAVANTTSATSLITTGTFDGSNVIQADSVLPSQPGPKTISVKAYGVLGTASIAPTLTITPLLGGVTLSTITVPVTGSLSSDQWEMDYTITVTGLTTANVGGCLIYFGSSGGGATACSSGAVTGLAFYSNQTFDVQATWSAASASNTITANALSVYPTQKL